MHTGQEVGNRCLCSNVKGKTLLSTPKQQGMVPRDETLNPSKQNGRELTTKVNLILLPVVTMQQCLVPSVEDVADFILE